MDHAIDMLGGPGLYIRLQDPKSSNIFMKRINILLGQGCCLFSCLPCPFSETLEQFMCNFRWCRISEARAASLPGTCQQRKLADKQQLSANVLNGKVELTRFIGKDTETDQFWNHRRSQHHADEIAGHHQSRGGQPETFDRGPDTQQ